MRILSLTKYGRLGASSRLRTLQYLILLEREGINVSSQALIFDEALSLRYKSGHYSPLFLHLEGPCVMKPQKCSLYQSGVCNN